MKTNKLKRHNGIPSRAVLFKIRIILYDKLLKVFAHIYFESGDWVSTYDKSWRKDQQMHEPKPQLNNARVVP